MRTLFKFKILLSAFFLLSSSLTIQAQGWYEGYDFWGLDDYATEILNTSDNGFILIGNRIVRTDSLGNLLWSKTIEFPLKNDVNYMGVKRAYMLEDGSFVLLMNNNFYNLCYLQKYDPLGVIVWEKEFTIDNIQGSTFECLTQMSDNGFSVMLNFKDTISGSNSVSIVRTDSIGETIWQKTFGPDSLTQFYNGGNIVGIQDENIVLAGNRWGGIGTDSSFVARIDEFGEKIWEKTSHRFLVLTLPKVLVTAEDNIVLFGAAEDMFLFSSFFVKYDLDGNELVDKEITEFGNTDRFTLQYESSSGGLIGLGHSFEMGDFIFSFDTDGNTNWVQNSWWQQDDDLLLFALAQTKNGSVAGCGYMNDFEDEITQGNDMLLMNFDSSGNFFGYHIQGQVFKDTDEDCNKDSSEIEIEGRVIKAAGDYNYYGFSNSDGIYSINLPEGDYQVSVAEASYWENCEPFYTAVLDAQTDTFIVDFPQIPAFECPLLFVDITIPFIRLCSEGRYYVHYCNEGTISAEDATVEVVLADSLTYLGASAPLLMQDGQKLTFDLDTLDVFECGSFSIDIEIGCDISLMGQTLCTEAHIFPDSLCNSVWADANIELSAICQNDSIHYTITNTGGDMNQPFEYIVIEDNIILMTDDFELLENDYIEESVEAKNGATYHVIAAQNPNLPPLLGNQIAVTSIEGCVGPVNTGAFNQIPFDDGEPWLSTDCNEVIASYDPNDKTAFPSGWQEEHFIEDRTDLEYLIRFQNTGTDTAFKVVLVDTLSPFLDPASIRLGASSHPFTFDLNGQGVAHFTFDDILLPDSTTNEPASNGFVKFYISQKSNNPIGTLIENTAYIYFDFNPPVQTNTVFHTIGEPWVEVILTSLNERGKNAGITVYPNPIFETATIELLNSQGRGGVFSLYHSNGQMVLEKEFLNNKIQLERNGMAAGIYFFKIENASGIEGSGKLVVR